jgi:Zn-dependent peptidase ImmA (M78 family)
MQRRESTEHLCSPAAQWLVRETGISDPVKAIRSVVQDFLASIGPLPYRVPIESLARKRGIRIVQSEEGGTEALLIPTKNGFIVRIDPRLGRSRYRFTLAHEIGHTFFFDSTASPRTRRYPYILGDAGEERLCQEAAAELLMPTARVTEFLETNDICVGTLALMATLFGVSFEAAARRITAFRSTFVFIGWSMRSIDGKPEALRVDWAASPGPFIPLHASNSEGTLMSVYHAYESGESKKAIEDLVLGEIRGLYEIESRGFHAKAPDRDLVVTLVNLLSRAPRTSKKKERLGSRQ